ncbi:MAG: YqgE/AlgH family protein [Pedosphaera sp.]|nr:YqgE/AlgH family protein [Pedosphaera sp.]
MAETFNSLKGQLLLDNGQLNGSFFHKAVVLICQHDADGAFGLVLNRSSDKKVGDVLVADLPDVFRGQILYLGGPVQPPTLSYLHSDTYLLQANVMPNLSLAHSVDSLVELGEALSPTQQVRVYAGYAGWGAGQLEDEMRRKSWVTHPASIDLVFTAATETLWSKILREKGWQYRLLAETPDDLTRN